MINSRHSSMVNSGHCLFTSFINMALKVFKTRVLIICFFTIHSTPSPSDTDSFHRALANFSSQKHLADAHDLTRADDLDPTQATWPAPTQSENVIL